MSKLLDENIIREKLEKLFPCLSGIEKLVCDNIDAEFFLSLARQGGSIPDMQPIDFWDLFITTPYSYDDKFKQLILSYFPEDDSLIVLSNYIGKNGILFKKDEFDLVVDIYSEVDFFQRDDYVIVNIDRSVMLIIHHSGHLFRIECK
jgi:hypothetical protein